MDAQNKVIVITGGASGIGRAAAYKFAEKGFKVVVADFEEVGGLKTVEEIQKSDGEAAFIKTDVANNQDVVAAVDFAIEKYGKIDVMFNNAGIGNGGASLLDHDAELYDKVIKVNQYGVYYGILAAGRKMKQLNIKGVIINTASAYGVLASQNSFSYNTSKAAVKMMTQSAALELAEYGIRVVGVAPGYVETPIMQRLKESNGIEKLTSKHMRSELLTSEMIADVVYLLSSEESTAINGSTLMLDDGYTQFK